MTEVERREFMSDALDLVIEHAGAARELCEVGADAKEAKIRLNLLQALAALDAAVTVLDSGKG